MFVNESKNAQSEDPMQFLKNRKAGAMKIASSAKEKGGDAMLSYYHFAAKEKPYNDIIALLRNEGMAAAKKHCKDKYNDLMKDVDIDMDQKEYQAIVGKIEVYGECYIKFVDLD